MWHTQTEETAVLTCHAQCTVTDAWCANPSPEYIANLGGEETPNSMFFK